MDDPDDLRRRPVVLQAGASGDEAPRRSRRYLAWAGTGLIGVVAAAGLVAGGTAVWTAFDPGTPGHSPAPLWFPPPETITPQSEQLTPTPSTTRTPTPTRTATADDHGGVRTPTPKSTSRPTDDKRGSGKNDSGKSGSDDGPNHH